MLGGGGVILQWTTCSILSIEIFLVSTCYGKEDKLGSEGRGGVDGPLGLNADFLSLVFSYKNEKANVSFYQDAACNSIMESFSSD